MKKYKVTYEMRYVDDIYGSSGVVGQYITEFSAEEDYAYNVVLSLLPTSTTNLRWMVDTLEEVI